MSVTSDWVGALAAVGVLVAIWWPIRLTIAHRVEQRFEDAFKRDRDGIIIGAEPIIVRGTRPGAVLLLHGYNDSPQAVSSLAEALHDAGWTVRAPLLPGHARTLQAFAQSGAKEWINAARAEYRTLRARYGTVVTCGMSMGGALALLIAAEQPDVRAVVTIAPYLRVSLPLRVLLALAPIAALGAKYMAGGGGRSVHDPAAAQAMIAYRMSTPRLVRELGKVTRAAFNGLPQVRQPVLYVQSREDNRIPARAADVAFERIGSADKTMDWRSGAGHVLTVDYGHASLERRIVEWLSSHMP